jgi:hypothetical protein
MLLLLLLKLSSLSVAASSSNACDETDLSCLHGKLLDQAIEIESLGRQVTNSLSRVKTADEMVQVYRDAARSAREALTEAEKALRPTPWYREPILWFSVGALVVGGLIVALVYGIVPAFQPH